ncbi:rod-binding protein [Yoonia sp. I 8.24]|uniref:rod-binding protein n=1 Tax=Yoonia sp. I 8.24 TaxID=1537229 RepID=UPI001EDD534E|nr:rod-binding protein [Yoonia sp. I 8.24]MCG3269119.1 rod-binding protein [Yoonia sp. I 8.24]
MTTTPVLPAPRPAPTLPDYIQNDAKLHAAAQQLEVSFLAEMLKSTGLGTQVNAFGGGAGEEHFGSFLREAQANEMVKSGGIGLAEALFEAMKAKWHA